MNFNLDDKHKELEYQGKFDANTMPYSDDDCVPVDENYVFIPKNIGFKIASFIYRSLMFLFGALATKVAFGTKYYGKEKLKPLKKRGYFTVMNHCSFIDSLILRHAIGDTRKAYLTVAPFNCKKGFPGHVLKAGGILPIADKLSAVKNMNKAFHELIEKRCVIQVYAEQAMWLHYEKPRPFKKGAFAFAVNENAPIVPIFIRWEPATGWRKLVGIRKKASAIVLDPIYPQEGLAKRDNINYMQKTTQKEFIDEYRRYFNIPKEEKPCIYDIGEEYIDGLDEETKYAMSL